MRRVIWNDEPGGNIEHIEQHGLTVEDVEHVLESPTARATSRSTNQPCVFGYTRDGMYIIVVFQQIDDETVYPITAYEVAE